MLDWMKSESNRGWLMDFKNRLAGMCDSCTVSSSWVLALPDGRPGARISEATLVGITSLCVHRGVQMPNVESKGTLTAFVRMTLQCLCVPLTNAQMGGLYAIMQ